MNNFRPSRLEAAREGNSLSDVYGTFLRSATEGLTGNYVKSEDIGDDQLPDMSEGFGKEVTKFAGNLAGSAVTIGAGEMAVAPIIAALGVTGAFAPIIAGTVAAMGYSALQNTDLKTKAIDTALAAIGGGIAAKFKLNKLSQLAEISTGEGAGVVSTAKKFGSDLTHMLGHDSGEVIDELKRYGVKAGVETESVPNLLAKFVQDFHANPTVAEDAPRTMQHLTNTMLDDGGKVKDSWLGTMSEISSEVKDVSQKLVSHQAFERGTKMQDDWGKTVIGATKNAFKNQLADPGNLLGEVPGGGQWFQKADDAIFLGNQLTSASSSYMEPISKDLAKIATKNPKYYKDLSTRISFALEDRPNAIKYFKDSASVAEKFGAKVPEGFENDVYKSFEGGWDFWKTALEKKGVPILDNYYTHVNKLLGDPRAELGNGMPQEIADAFFKERTGGLKDFNREDIIKVYKQYENHVSRKVAFDDLINDFEMSEKHPVVAKFLTGVVNSKREPGGIIDWITGQRYKNLVAYNPFSALSNLSQQAMARARVSPEAVSLSKQLRKIDDPKIVNFLNRSFSNYAESVIPKELGEVKGKFDALKFFEKTEGRNWLNSRSMGVAEELVQNPRFNELVKGGMSKQDAMMHVLEDDGIWKRAMTRGSDLASKTQFTMAKGLRPDLFEAPVDNPLLRVPMQFMRFQVSNLESAVNLFRERGKEVEILRRGFQDETNVVDRLRAMKTMAMGAKDLIKKSVSEEEKGMLRNIMSELGEDSGYLKSEINRIEPRSTLRSAQEVGRLIVSGTAPKLARTWLKWGLVGYIFNKEFKPESKASDIVNSALGQIPGLEFVRGADLNPRYTDPKYGLVSTGTSLTPGLGMIDTLLPGRPITKAAYDLAFSKDHDIDESRPKKKTKRGGYR